MPLKRMLFAGGKSPSVKRLKTLIGKTINLSRRHMHAARRVNIVKHERALLLRQTIRDFLKRPDHAYELSSKKDQVRGEGRFSLTMTLENLHVQFMRENPTIGLCFSSFCNAHTPNIRLIRFTHRKQCLCRKCANICLKSDVVKALPKTPKGVRGDVKIQVLATARFCKSLQTLATTGLPTLSQVCQPLARSEKQTPCSRYPSNDILITLIAH